MYLQRLIRIPRNYLIFACVFLTLTLTAFAEVVSSDLFQSNQKVLHSLLGFLLIALVLILLASFALIRHQGHRKEGWERRAEEREFAKLIEESVHAGQSAIEKHTG